MPTHIVASEYRNAVGVPALFPAEFFADLVALTGDRGAKPLFTKFQNRLLRIPLPEAGFDIDRAEDYDYLIGRDSAAEANSSARSISASEL